MNDKKPKNEIQMLQFPCRYCGSLTDNKTYEEAPDTQFPGFQKMFPTWCVYYCDNKCKTKFKLKEKMDRIVV